MTTQTNRAYPRFLKWSVPTILGAAIFSGCDSSMTAAHPDPSKMYISVDGGVHIADGSTLYAAENNKSIKDQLDGIIAQAKPDQIQMIKDDLIGIDNIAFTIHSTPSNDSLEAVASMIEEHCSKDNGLPYYGGPILKGGQTAGGYVRSKLEGIYRAFHFDAPSQPA